MRPRGAERALTMALCVKDKKKAKQTLREGSAPDMSVAGAATATPAEYGTGAGWPRATVKWLGGAKRHAHRTDASVGARDHTCRA